MNIDSFNKKKDRVNRLTAPLEDWQGINLLSIKSTFFAISYILVFILSGLLITRAITAGLDIKETSSLFWTRQFDVFLVLFLLIDFIVINRTLSKNRLRYQKLLFWILIGLIFVIIFWGIAQKAYPEQEIYSFNNLAYFGILVLGVVSLVWKDTRRIFERLKIRLRKEEKWLKYLFFITLLVTILVQVLSNFAQNQIINSVLEIYNSFRGLLFLVVIATGVSFIYLSREKIKAGLEKEGNRERTEEERRKEFPEKYWGINKVPFIRNIVGWIYKEGWFYSLGLILIFLFGIGLRLWNADMITPGRDEFHHLIAGKAILQTGNTVYSGSLYIGYLLSALFNLFRYSLFWARLPVVIIGSISVLLIYFLGKKISKKIGLLSALLFATSPWAIGISRFVRQYSFDIFIELCLILILFYLFKKLSNHSLSLLKFLVFSSIPFLFVIFWQRTQQSTTVSILPFLIITFIILIYQRQKDIFNIIKRNYKLFLAAISLIFFLGYLIFVNIPYNFIDPTITYNSKWLDLFFNSEIERPMQWYSFTQTPWFFLVFLISAGLWFYRKNKYYLIYFITFTSYLAFFVFLSKPHVNYLIGRYMYCAFPAFVLIISSGIYSLFSLGVNSIPLKIPKIAALLILLAFFLSVFNPVNTYLGAQGLLSTAEGNSRQPFSVSYRNLSELFNYLDQNNFSKNDIVITDIPDVFVWYYDFDIAPYKKRAGIYDKAKNIYSIQRLNETLLQYDSGWIIVGVWRKVIPLNNFERFNKAIEYNGIFSRHHGIYKWNNKND